MKRIASLLLTIALLLSLCVFGAAADAEGTPITEENGFHFVEPHAYKGQRNGLKEKAGAKDSRVECSTYIATMEKPTITRSLPDREGYVTYTVKYTLKSGAEFEGPKKVKDWGITVNTHEFCVLDQYTGQRIKLGDTATKRDETKKSSEKTEFYVDGELVTISSNKRVKVKWGDYSWIEYEDSWFGTTELTVQMRIRLRVPADYDGLVIGMNPRWVTEGKHREKDEYNNDVEYWDDFENIEDWEFIRLSDWAEFEELKRDSEGDSVKTLQRALRDLGFLSGKITGKFDKNTEKALRAFQKEHELPKTGVLDEANWLAIEAALGG